MSQNGKQNAELTVTDVEKLLEERIRSSAYPIGTQLPTVRELAEELGVNRNTTVRAYQALRRKGYLELARGRGAFVRERQPLAAAANTRWLMKLDQLLEEAREQSLSRDMVLREIRSNLDRVFGQDGDDLRIGFVECNLPDVQLLGGELSSAVGRQLQGVLLSDFLNQPQVIAQQFDLVVTTFFHLSEVSWALGEDGKQKVIGVLAKPTLDSLLDIARLHAPVIGLVCTLASTIDNLVHIIHTYHPSATVLPVLIDDEPRLQMVVSKADALVVTRVSYDQLMEHQPKLPVIKVTFTIDQQSIDFLRSRIWEHKGASLVAVR